MPCRNTIASTVRENGPLYAYVHNAVNIDLSLDIMYFFVVFDPVKNFLLIQIDQSREGMQMLTEIRGNHGHCAEQIDSYCTPTVILEIWFKVSPQDINTH